jgi:hypothetical protein
MVEKYAKLSMPDRDKLELIIDGMLNTEPEPEPI